MSQSDPLILIADDDPIIQELGTHLLEAAGYTVETVQDGIGALDRVRQGGVELLLLDIWMPGKTGLEVLEELRKSPAPPRVIILTSDTTSDTLLHAIREHAYMYLDKPIQREALLSAVESSFSTSPQDLPIEVISASPNWVELLVPCDLSTAERIRSFMTHLDADLDDDARDVIGIAFDELVRNAIEWGGKARPESQGPNRLSPDRPHDPLPNLRPGRRFRPRQNRPRCFQRPGPSSGSRLCPRRKGPASRRLRSPDGSGIGRRTPLQRAPQQSRIHQISR
jgi:CheY-like chemotaxis protein